MVGHLGWSSCLFVGSLSCKIGILIGLCFVGRGGRFGFGFGNSGTYSMFYILLGSNFVERFILVSILFSSLMSVSY